MCGAGSARRVRSASCRLMMRSSRSAFSFASSPITTRIVRACRSARSSNWSARLLSVVCSLPREVRFPYLAACRAFISATTGISPFSRNEPSRDRPVSVRRRRWVLGSLPEGIERSRRENWKHGHYSRERRNSRYCSVWHRCNTLPKLSSGTHRFTDRALLL